MNVQYAGTSGGDEGTAGAGPRLRSYFPETWYWNPLVVTDADGAARFELTAPDTITTWKMEVVASTLEGDIGSGELDIVVFQDFFVEPDLPVKAVLGDEFELRATVYNYLDVPSTVQVGISATGLEVVSPDKGSAVLGPNSVSSVSVRLRATDVGDATVSLDATNEHMADAVERTVRVVPNGVVEENVENGILEDTSSVSLAVNLSEDRVPGSEVAYVKLQGSMNAVALDGAEEYIQYVSGCGEQSLSTLSMDVLAYRMLDPSLGNDRRRQYEQIVVQGLLHELAYLVNDPAGHGRGIVWFPSDQGPHPWLTSWGLITFQDALDAGFDLDDAIIDDMQEFIVAEQHADGSFTFPEWGLYEYTPDVLKSKTVATTAYVARSLAYSGYQGSAIAEAVTYIEARLSEVWDDPYSLAIALIVLDAEGSSSAARVADRLETLAKRVGDEVHWETESTMIDSGSREWFDWGYGSSPQAIETTGYAVMALDELRPALAVGGTRYLLGHRTQGGWFSTRDTVVSFQAISRQSILEVEEMTITVSVDGVEVSSVDIDAESADVTRYIDLRPYVADAFDVELTSEGTGEIAYQLVTRVNVPAKPLPLPIDIDVILPVVNVSVGDAVAGTVTVSYNGTGPLQMILVELPVPAGFSPDTSAYTALIGHGVDNVEVEDGVVRLYITPVDPGSTIELPYSVRADLEATSTMTGAVVWDMYEPALRAVSAEMVLTAA